ncbi:MAG: hypothetical protein JWR16_2006 [Nevskia sp.]|nr:hypothetical protein [Nevskia sp.]
MRAAMVLILALLLSSCAHQDLKAPCKHPLALLEQDDGCGPLRPL